MHRDKNLLFVGRQLPCHTAHASEIIFYRHLSRLQKSGVGVMCAVPGALIGSGEHGTPFKVLRRRTRRWWWPPSSLLRRLPPSYAAGIWRREILNQVQQAAPQLIVAHVADNSFFQAQLLAEALKVPLAGFAHDAPIHFSAHEMPRLQVALGKTAKLWCVSKPLKELMTKLGASSSSVLLPIPSGNGGKSLNPPQNDTRRLAIVGSIYEPTNSLKVIDEACDRYGLQYSIIAPKPPTILADLKRAEYVGFFNTPEECLQYVSQNCSGFIIPYPMPSEVPSAADFLEYSFPSRFLEISQLGLPILITSSPGFAISDWCKENAPSLLAMNPQDVDDWMLRFLSQHSRSELGNAVQRLHENCFDPDAIHSVWEQDVLKLMET